MITDRNLDPVVTPSNNMTVSEMPRFRVEECGEYTAELKQTLAEALLVLEPALHDAQFGNKSAVFSAIFKLGDTKEFVQDILTKIFSGTRMIDLQPNPYIPTIPTFACVTPYTWHKNKFLKADPYALCMPPLGIGQAFIMQGTSYIYLCPSFWTRPPWPSFPDCPSVWKNRWVGPGQYLSNYQGYLLIHEMVHFYLGGSSLGLSQNPPEVYEFNGCVGLGTYDSLHNPQNYQNYVACKTRTVINMLPPETS